VRRNPKSSRRRARFSSLNLIFFLLARAPLRYLFRLSISSSTAFEKLNDLLTRRLCLHNRAQRLSLYLSGSSRFYSSPCIDRCTLEFLVPFPFSRCICLCPSCPDPRNADKKSRSRDFIEPPHSDVILRRDSFFSEFESE